MRLIHVVIERQTVNTTRQSLGLSSYYPVRAFGSLMMAMEYAESSCKIIRNNDDKLEVIRDNPFNYCCVRHTKCHKVIFEACVKSVCFYD